MKNKDIFEDLSKSKKFIQFEKCYEKKQNFKETILNFIFIYFHSMEIHSYKKLNGSQLKDLYYIIENHHDLLYKTKELYEKQGFILKKQSMAIKDIIYKRKKDKELEEAEQLFKT